MIIESAAPTRIDLAGGTIDIWPLYLFHRGAQTVNAAIDLYARCRIETGGEGYSIESRDTNTHVEGATLDELAEHSSLELLVRLVRFFAPKPGFSLVTESGAPPGSGLGGSSTLGIAVCAALDRLMNTHYTREQIRTVAMNIETQVIRVPAGFQDYYPALHGGVNSIRLDIDGVRAEPIAVDVEDLERRLVLAYTGMPHFSGTNNWEIFKAHIDGTPEIFERFEQIRDTTEKMRAALTSGDLDAVGRVLGQEWENRRALAPGVSTPTIDELIRIAQSAGAPTAKVCGAGGGGCVLFFCNYGQKHDVDRALRDAGAQVLDFHLDMEGVKVKATS
jgi:D-glycero-alpha-D-manno-heptose-7-phosphate kinase